MSSIQTGIELNDQFSGVLNNIVNSVNLAVSAMYDMQQSMNADIDTSSIEGARDEINQATAAINAMNEALNNQTAPDIAPPVVDEGNQEPIPAPIDPIIPDPLVEILNPSDRRFSQMHPLNLLKYLFSGNLTTWKYSLALELNGFSKKFRVQTVCWNS